MEAFGPFLDGFANVHLQLWEHLRAKTFAALDAHDAQKAAMNSIEAVAARAAHVRNTFLESIGGLPETGGPLHPRICGRLERDGYVIEKIVYESRPNVYVTSLLYLPVNAPKPAPAVLFVSGHHRDAKGNPEYQRIAHDLARNGFVVLAIDPTGQGERVTHLDPDSGEMALEWGTTEHSFQGVQCILAGSSIARYFLFDALRGIDYLESRPEVDPDRIGVTGNSGGGTQTSLVCMSGDPRIKAAAPCTYVTSREDYYPTGQPQDAEQLQFGMTKNGIDFDDFFIPFAPRPLLIGAVASDFFNPEGTNRTYERLRRIYGIFGREAAVRRVFAPGMHSYCRELRQAAVNWFRQHLLEAEPSFATAEDTTIPTLPDSALWCTTKGHVRTDFPDARSPHELNLEFLEARQVGAGHGLPLPSSHRRGVPPNRDDLRERLVDTLGIRERLESPCLFHARTIRDQEQDGFHTQSVFFMTEPGIMGAACLLRAAAPSAHAVLFLAGGGTKSLDRHAEEFRGLLGDGNDVFVFDVRGTGSLESHPVNACSKTFPMTFFNTDAIMAWSAYCLGESLLGMRAFDAMRAAAYLLDEARYARVDLIAHGLEPCLCGHLAAALEPRIDRIVLYGGLESFDSIVRTPLYRRDFTPSLLVHGIVPHADLPALEPLFAGRKIERA